MNFNNSKYHARLSKALILIIYLGALFCVYPAFSQNDFEADTVTIIQSVDQGYGQRHVVQTMTTKEFVHEWNLGNPLTFADASRDPWESIVPTPEPPVHTSPFENGDQVVFHRSGTFDNFRYNRTTTYEYAGGPGGAGSAGDPWAMPSNDVTVEGCGVSCDEDDEEQMTQ
ncbi:MAG: hypothetical protein KKC01_02040 [Gammaproteobacteria bacterium]|nr:hypothetical protein [Gammaproteobacteria bacterium]